MLLHAISLGFCGTQVSALLLLLIALDAAEDWLAGLTPDLCRRRRWCVRPFIPQPDTNTHPLLQVLLGTLAALRFMQAARYA